MTPTKLHTQAEASCTADRSILPKPLAYTLYTPYLGKQHMGQNCPAFLIEGFLRILPTAALAGVVEVRKKYLLGKKINTYSLAILALVSTQLL